MSNKAFQVDFLLAGVEGAELGTATFYAAGTTTLKTIWLDRNKATPAANPYTLDANGRAQLYADGIYKIVIKNAAGTTLHTYDNVSFGLSDGPWVDVAEYASLTAAVTAIGATVTDLLIDSTTTCTANTVVPANIRLKLTRKGAINQGSYTLTINAPFEADLIQVFTGTGTVSFGIGTVKTVEVAWFGANLARAVASISTTAYEGQSVTVQLRDGENYMLDDTLVIPDRVTVRGAGIWYTNARIMASNNWPDPTHPLIKIGNPNLSASSYWSFHSRLENAYVDGRGLVQTAVYSNSVNENSGIFDTWISGMTKYGIWFDGSNYGATLPRVIHTDIFNCSVNFTDTSSSSAPNKQPVDTANAIGIYILGASPTNGVNLNLSVTKSTVTSGQGAAGGVKPQNAIVVKNSGLVNIEECHTEYHINGIVIDNSHNTLIKNYDAHNSLTNAIKLTNGPLYYTFININGNGAATVIADDTTNKNKNITGQYNIQFYSSGRNYFDVLRLINSADTTSGNPSVGQMEFYGIDKTLQYPRLGAAIYASSTGDWNASADIDYAPTQLFIGVGQSSTTNTPYNAPSMQFKEGETISWNQLRMKSKAILFESMSSASAPNNSIFMDAADNIIKIKDNTGVVRLLY